MSRDGRTDDREVSDVKLERAPTSPRPSSSSREKDEFGRPGGSTTVATSPRDVVIWRDRVVHLRESARVTLRTVGTFRTVAVPDLVGQVYGGNQRRYEADVRTLVRRGWLERHTLPGRRGGRAVSVLVLSKEGRAFTAQHVVRDAQTGHAGLVKPKEQAHDTALYRVAHAEGQRIARAGGTVRRVVLDAELKGQVASARNRPGTGDEGERTAAVARALQLRVVDGTVQIPDVRLEYETREGTQARVDLELATEHYKPSQVAAKAQAGFTIYAPASETGRLTAALQDRGILAEILFAMSIGPSDVEAIAALGYTPREAGFLARVAHHSGYFIRRQYLQWIGSGPGQTVVDFTQKLLARRHATLHTFCYATHVYHLSARILYAAAAAPTSHRRRRVALAVKARLMALDYALARPELHFLTTDEERLAFCDALGIDRAWLPQRRYAGFRSITGSIRYFVEAAPMGLLHEEGALPTLVCGYIDDGTASVSGFETHLRDYRRLWVSVPRWRLVYIADAPRRLVDAVSAFRRICAEPVALPLGADPDALASLLDYFQLRRVYDARHWASLDTAALDRFRDLRRRFAGHDWEVLYGQWEGRGEEAIRRVLSAPAPAITLNPSAFESCVLGHSYVATSPVRRRA